ncbi:MAG: histidine phosphatase family protein [Pseudomonadota bacterium]
MIFLRHPQTDAPDGLCYGRLEVGLGEGSADQIRDALSTVPVVRNIVSSPARRCTQLADRLAARGAMKIDLDPRLLEYNFGGWEGRYWSDIPRADSDLWMRDLWSNRPPGGEAYAEQHARVAQALSDVPKDAVVICHAGTIRAARMILLGESFDQVFAEKIPFCEPITLQRLAA